MLNFCQYPKKVQQTTKNISITKVIDTSLTFDLDNVAIEEPLEIRVEYGTLLNRITKNISVTMRTPGHDEDLATGFLFTEGIVQLSSDIAGVGHRFIPCAENKENVIKVSLKPGVEPQLQNSERNFYTTSSCGVCGKASIGAIKTTAGLISTSDDLFIDTETLYSLPKKLRKHQAVFEETGGLHASALFDGAGNLVLLREDVGRHNALDKVIGASLLKNIVPLSNYLLLLSGRASFELVQKAVMANIKIIVSVGAPSSLAIEIAQEFGITLVGFLREKRFNIYTCPQRILQSIHENKN